MYLIVSNALECEVKWALESITMNKASGGDRIPVELFQILKDDAVKVLHSICQQIWKTQQWSQDWKRSVFVPIPRLGRYPGEGNGYPLQYACLDKSMDRGVWQATVHGVTKRQTLCDTHAVSRLGGRQNI